MAGPFGIEQVNIPGLLGMHQQMKARRLEELYRAQQIQVAQQEADLNERKADREERTETARAGILAKLFTAKGGGQTSTPVEAAAPPTPAASPASSTPAPVATPDKFITPRDAQIMRTSLGDKYDGWLKTNGLVEFDPDASPAGSAGVAASPTQSFFSVPRQDGVTINEEALRDLAVLDADAAKDILDLVGKLDERQLKQATERGGAMANVAHALRSVPAGQRKAELVEWAPWLVEHGVPEEAIMQADLSDAGLDRYFRQGRAIEKIVQSDEGAAADNESRRRWEASEARAARAEGRAAVRFSERDKDRAALAASGGGVRSDTSDLNY